ncbi:MAG: SAM-dependent chlorinase/fluorinase [Dehalococcoidia bacterium]|nr:SAM-dependent chlorinase/fluorinase [Dehalococcoidia bacterium]
MKNTNLISAVLFFIFMIVSCFPGCAAQNEIDMPVVLLTDYGIEDYRIAELKGIILTNNPQARIIDASHSIPAFDIATGAFMLDVAAREFPENIVFIAIVAPYTQPETTYLVLTTEKNQLFVLPDNGLLTYVVKNMRIKALYRATDEKLFNRPMSELVAERVQGKIGAILAAGYDPGDLGVPATKYRTLDVQEPAISGSKVMGTVVFIDAYGNAVTNLSKETAEELGLKPGDKVWVTLLQTQISATWGTIYSDVPEGKEVVFICNNLDMVQLSINLGSFADKYGVKAGSRIQIEK